MTNESAVRKGCPSRSRRVKVATETKRVYASGWSPALSTIGVNPYSRTARGLAIAASVGSPRSATSRAASAVVAAATATASGSEASRLRHWSSAIGWERITRSSPGGTTAGPARQCSTGSTTWPTIESHDS